MESPHDLSQWKRHLDDIFFMENVPGMIHLLKNLNIPIRSMIRESRHVDDQKIPSECMYPRRLGNMPFELPLCVDVEDKAATWRQMLTRPCEHSFPVGEASNVINRIEYTKNRVKPPVDLEIDHILPQEFRLRNLLAGNRKHLAREIQPRHFVTVLQMLQY